MLFMLFMDFKTAGHPEWLWWRSQHLLLLTEGA
jgi:hypothetical protein